MTDCKIVSVVIPAFNRLKMLERAICSVLEQSCCNYELIVVDDGSIEDLSPLRAKVVAAGQKWCRTANRGVAAARNCGWRQATGYYLAFLDSDDEWLPKKLEKQLSYLGAHPQYRWCQCEEKWFRDGRFMNQCKHHQKPLGDAFARSLELCCISPSSVLLERSLFAEFDGFDENFVVCEDYELWLRITAKWQVGLVPDVLVHKYGGHEDQLSHSQPVMDRFRIFALLQILAKGGLSEKQQQMVIRELRSKVNVVLSGARKHGNDALIAALSSLSSVLSDTKPEQKEQIAELSGRLSTMHCLLENS